MFAQNSIQLMQWNLICSISTVLLFVMYPFTRVGCFNTYTLVYWTEYINLKSSIAHTIPYHNNDNNNKYLRVCKIQSNDITMFATIVALRNELQFLEKLSSRIFFYWIINFATKKWNITVWVSCSKMFLWIVSVGKTNHCKTVYRLENKRSSKFSC